MTTKDKIREILQKSFVPLHLEVVEESHLHASHAEAIEGKGGHFRVEIIASQFEGISLLSRHRKIYAALHSIKSDIHALAIHAHGPNEK
jgi:BolA protein